MRYYRTLLAFQRMQRIFSPAFSDDRSPGQSNKFNIFGRFLTNSRGRPIGDNNTFMAQRLRERIAYFGNDLLPGGLVYFSS